MILSLNLLQLHLTKKLLYIVGVGMRSNAFADHLIENGFFMLLGYKAFRNVVRFFEQL
jgi:hypothetical protein